MGQFTIGLTSGPVTGSKTYTISDADVTRWIAALRTREPFDDPSLTNAQVLGKWADSVMGRQRLTVRRAEEAAATKAAKEEISDIGVT